MKTAEMLKRYLLRSGVDAGRITEVKSLGNRDPLCKEFTTLCDQLNRRVALKLVKKRTAEGCREGSGYVTGDCLMGPLYYDSFSPGLEARRTLL